MANNLAHFAINADDVDRAVQFYQSVFGWTIEPWGPPGFFQIQPTADGVRGAIQRRRQLGSSPIGGFECTISVDDLEQVTKRVLEHGGKTLMEKATIAGVGELMFFEDSEGNTFGAMRYDATLQ